MKERVQKPRSQSVEKLGLKCKDQRSPTTTNSMTGEEESEGGGCEEELKGTGPKGRVRSRPDELKRGSSLGKE